MANDYFNHENPLTRHTLGRAEQVNSTFSAIEAAFDKLPTPDQINRGSVAYVLDLGTVNSYVVNFARVPESYTEGMNFTMKAATTNTGPSVINVNGLGPKQIRRYDGQPLEPGDIRAGQLVILGYDGSRFLIMGVHGGEVAKARQWASSTTLVEGGLYGARGYAQQADRWANENLDVVVEGGRYSAKHWALRAEINAGLLPDENNDIPARVYRDLGTSAEPFRNLNLTGIATATAYRTTEIQITGYQIHRMSDSGVMVISGGDSSASGANIQLFAHGFGRLRSGPNELLRWNADGAVFAQPLKVEADLTVGSSGRFIGDGSGLTDLPAGSLTGTLSNARLSGDYSFGSLTLSGDLTTDGSIRVNGSNIFIRSDSNKHLWYRDSTGTNLGALFLNQSDGRLILRVYNASGSVVHQLGLDRDGHATFTGAIYGNGEGITNLNASNISSGTLPAARLPNHSAALLTSGTLSAARLPNHSANLLTSGTLPNGRLSGDYSFANLTLSGMASASGGISTQHLRLGTATSYAIHRNTDNSWLELAGGDDAGKGAVIRLYGPDNNDDGRLMQGGNTHLSWGSFGVRVDNGAGGLCTVATVYAGSDGDNTDFPIGHVIWGIARDMVNRNASATVRASSSESHQYDVAGGTGTALSGTWRSRGRYNTGYVMQRTA